jgi:hypothetical protein
MAEVDGVDSTHVAASSGVFAQALDVIQRAQKSAFVTGKAGTGKSTLLRQFRSECPDAVVVAPTGMAALNVEGQTVHGLFRFPPTFVDADAAENRVRRLSHSTIQAFKKMRTLVIDEVSMVRADMLDGIDVTLRISRQNPSPFGGVQVVMFGDCLQLAPIVSNADLKTYFDRNYRSEYFFDAKVFARWECQYVELGQVFRQRDPDFLKALSGLRGESDLVESLQILNRRAISSAPPDGNSGEVTLTPTNSQAAYINAERLEACGIGATHEYDATTTGPWVPDYCPTDSRLRLRVGATVLMARNDPLKRWVNGSAGRVTQLDQNSVGVLIGGAEHRVERVKWDQYEYTYDHELNSIAARPVATFCQFPLRLGYAMTIHRSQGQTLDAVCVDLGDGAFAPGQAYVAVSRCRTLAGLRLARPLTAADVSFDVRTASIAEKFVHPSCEIGPSTQRGDRLDTSVDANEPVASSAASSSHGGLDQDVASPAGSDGGWRWIMREAEAARKLTVFDLERGLRRFADLLTSYPNDGMLYFKRGEAHEIRGDLSAASQDYAKAKANFPQATWRLKAELASERVRAVRTDPKNAEGNGWSN